MIVSMWMTRNPITIEPATSLTEAASIMAGKHIRRLPVVKQQARIIHPVGIITATDILHAYPPEINPFAVAAPDTKQGGIRAEDIMSRALQTVSPETPIEEAARIMRNEKISTLLVMQKGSLAGLITESDIFRVFVSIFASPGGGVRLTFAVGGQEDVFRIIAPVALRWDVRIVSMISVVQEGRNLCVVRIAGSAVDEMLKELWSSGHSVLNVLRQT